LSFGHASTRRQLRNGRRSPAPPPHRAHLEVGGACRAQRSDRAWPRIAGAAWLGANLPEIDGELVVRRVAPEGPAAGAGVQHGGRVVAIDGSQVRDLAGFDRAVSGPVPLRSSPN
jgi:predicted metalloprotease with PDZ domain